ncbi:esterase family protein [Pelagicoccus sp. NFK12]|uniref:Esterase family protein n=1 Tax=Pelagicoccus enzymogenes TaxID=2773457 RepID=A0A927IGV9_9BACT|nr:alpha/beta hydrolase-fold protein [Pelagicoccus enzymogenes]MBD5779083.1 esterase family protein [Pelagicoccus enzymogenes]
MKLSFLTVCILAVTTFAFGDGLEIRTDLQGLTDYHLPQEGIPKGRLDGPFEFHSEVFEGTVRRYWIFVPAQYDPSTPAGLLVFHDGQRATHPEGVLRVHQVMENLIGKGEMPVSIGLFITPGNRSERYPDDLGWSNPNHRAPEYDAMSDRYSRFLVDEMLPELEKSYRISDDPSMRCIGGTSSGAICAFTVAWHRPEEFGKVLSFIGSYVSIGFRPYENPPRLGGQDYPALIRREPIRPIKIFLQDGNRDLDNEWGNWFLANQQMLAAFRYANAKADRKGEEGPRYDVEAVWTDGVHNDDHAGALLPEALKWMYENR